MAKRKKTERQKLRDNLDKLWADAVKRVAGYKCEKCGRDSKLNSHHVFSRSNLSTRWDLQNGYCLCAGCHVLCNDSAHKAPADFVEWSKVNRGLDWYDDLRQRAHMPVKFSIMDLEEIAGRLRQ